MTTIDPAEIATWPDAVTEIVDELAGELEHRIESPYATDLTCLDIDGEIEQRLRHAASGHDLLAYHATRLLPHERDWLLRDGLEPYSDDLRGRKMRGAATHFSEFFGSDVDDDVDAVLAIGPHSFQPGADRAGWVCLVSPLAIFTEEPEGFGYLFGRWGGEAVGWIRDDDEYRRQNELLTRLDQVSIPTIVEFKVPIDSLAIYRSVFPTLLGSWLKMPRASMESRTRQTIPASALISLIDPSSERWPPSAQIFERN